MSKDLNTIKWQGLPHDFNVEEWFGFVYLIVNKTNQRKYIGRKYFFTERKKPKKTGVRKREVVRKESDWKKYQSSCIPLKEDIKSLGEDCFSFEIIGLYKTKSETNYAEVKEQFVRDVLKSKLPNGEREYYNTNILSRYFLPKPDGTKEYEQKCENISKALKEKFASGEISHPLKGKVHPNKGKKLPQTGHDKNRGRVSYTDGVKTIRLKPEDPVPPGFNKGVGVVNRPSKVESIRKKYESNPILCGVCNKPIPFERRRSCKTCSEVCSLELRRGNRQHQRGSEEHPYFKGYWVTPFGKFPSLSLAAEAIPQLNQTTIFNRCKKGKNGWWYDRVEPRPTNN